LSDGRFDEDTFEALLTEDRMPPLISRYWIIKIQARFMAGDYRAGLIAAESARKWLWSSESFIQSLDYHYYVALTLTACYETGSADEQRGWHERLTAHQEQLREWAENYQPTFGDKHALVSAELARIESRPVDAMRLYEEAIRAARENGFVQNEGLAYEVAARFYMALGLETIADAQLRNARHCYLRWGADGKVRQLDRLYPHLTAVEGHRPPAGTGSPVQQLDVATVVKASQAVSSEIVFSKLIERLMTIAVENAGADRGLLILPADDAYLIQAEAQATDDRVEVALCQTPISGTTCPESLVRYVIRTHESVILDDASRPNLFSDDNYLRGRQTKSILCLPLIKQGRLTGLIYLENKLASGAFTADRSAVLELMAAQAAISLENTRLYSDLQEREAKAREAQMALAHANRVTTMGQLTASIAHEVNQPIAAVVTNAHAALRFLGGQPANLEEVRQALDRIIRDGNRAGDVIGRIRALIKKVPARQAELDINEAILEVIELMRSELLRNGVALQTELANGLPLTRGDRIQVQQIVLNLIMNAVEAMADVSNGSRDLLISTAGDISNGVLVTVRDSGPGLTPESLERLFDPFYTTKPGGMGMGLSICRSIIEAHGGRVWAAATVPRGASFQFTLPAHSSDGVAT
jgi:signal transduction histidine kinase